MRQLLLCFLLVFISLRLYPQVLLNEFSSSNISKLSDEDGDFSDWIELYNNSSSGINLGGYFLSDTVSFLKKWTFPAVQMNPYSHLVIFASGKNRTELPVTYKNIISRDAEWRYLVPASETGSSWKNIGFDASSWNTGSAGFGYGDDDDATVLNNIVSVFIRKEFTITNLQNIEELILSIDYDDGFAAYINGHEIARNNLGTISPVPFNQLTGSLSREATMYLGGLPENYIVSNPQTFLVEGTNVIAIQGHNAAEGSSDFTLIPMLSLGRLESGASDSLPDYISLKGRELHTNFKISDEGETLILSRPDSSIVDSVAPVALPADLSYGRKPDGDASWLYFALSTPGTSNITKGFNTINSDTVIFSAGGGYYPGGVSIGLSSVDLSDSIFYTLDGSEPTLLSTRYISPFFISGGSVVRARSIKSDRLPGVIATNSYVTKRHTLPVVCLSTDPANLWDYNTGIYVMGPNASPDSPYFGANFWEEWERRGHIELYDVNGVRQIDQDIGIKIFGAYSRAFPQKSLALFARKEYGKGSFDYKIFSDKPIEKFESLVLRNSGNDWGQGMIRDALTSTIIHDMDVDRQAYQPAAIYINGEYWGILDIREKVNSNFLAENHFINPDNVNLLEFDGNAIEGTNTGYRDIIDYLNNNTLENDQKYREVSRKIDLNSYIQYQMTQIYVNNKDWPGNNIKFWNTTEPGSLWRWIIFDTDFGFSIWETGAYNFNTLAFALDAAGPGWPNPPWSTLLFRRMASNQGFRNEFSNQFADRLNTNFTSEKVNGIIDSLRQLLLPEINDHITRWELSYDNWQYNFENIKNFATFRPDYSRSHLRSQFHLGKTLNITVEIDDPGTGYVKINSIIPEKYPFHGVYFKDLPIRLTAIPAPGYKFAKWQMGSLISNDVTIDYPMFEPRNFKAVFEPAISSDYKIVVNEINYNSSPARDTKDWVELLNAGRSTVNLKDWIISDGGPETGFVISSDYILAPGMYIVICRDQEAFRQFCPKVTNATGDIEFGLSSSGDDVNLYDSDRNLIDFVRYTDMAPWPVVAAGTGVSIELTDPLSDNNKGQNWKAGTTGGTPGAINSQTVPSDTIDGPGASDDLLTCYPNPFRDYTTIRLEVTEAGRYRVEIYDIQGRPVRMLADQSVETGQYYIDWDGTGNNNSPLPGGVYIIKLSGEKHHTSTKVIILK